MILLRKHRRSAFTLVELLVVAMLTTLLAMLLASVWSGLGRPISDALASAHITQEANLAAAALARDFGGSLPESSARLGYAVDGQWVGRMQPGGTELRLCFDGPVSDGVAQWAPPDTVIDYYVQGGRLIRANESDGSTFVVARHVTHLDLVDEGASVQIRLTFAFRQLTKTYTFVGFDP